MPSSAVNTTVQKLFVLCAGIPADTVLAPQLAQLFTNNNIAAATSVLDNYLGGQAAAIGATALVNRMALQGLGVHLTPDQAAYAVSLITSGTFTWGGLALYLVNDYTGPGATTLANRATVGQAFTDALVAQSKGAFFGGTNIFNDTTGLLAGVTDSAATVTQGISTMQALVTNMGSAGLSQKMADGYITGATVFVDANGNGQLDSGEATVLTGASGTFTIAGSAPAGDLVGFGGTDLMTGQAFHGVLRAPAGATVLNPFTTLAEGLMHSGAAGSAQAAANMVRSALALPSTLNLLNYDPIADLVAGTNTTQALAVQQVMFEVGNVIALASVALDAASPLTLTQAANLVIQSMADSLAAGTLNLTNAHSISLLITDSVSDYIGFATPPSIVAIIDQLATVISNVNTAASQTTNIHGLAQVTAVAEGSLNTAITSNFSGVGSLTDTVNAFSGTSLDNAIHAASVGSLTTGTQVPAFVAPTLTVFAGAIDTTAEDTQVEITYAELADKGNEADTDGFVNSFVVKGVSSGTLRIGTSAGTATAWAANTNDVIDATHNAYWTPAANANGSLSAFTAVARDNDGQVSATPLQAVVTVSAVNDAPTLTSFASTLGSTSRSVEFDVSLADLLAFGNEADVDGTVTAFVIQGVSSGTLRIGSASGFATAWAPGTNDVVDATHSLFWTSANDANGTVNAFTAVARDDLGALSTGAVQAQITVTPPNVRPTLTSFAAPVATLVEDIQGQITFAQLAAQGNEADSDGTVTAFVIKAVTTGTLKIGTSEATATFWAAGTNDVVDATHNIYWTAAANANGTLNAFTAVARDDLGAVSTTAIQAQVSVTAVNDPARLTAFSDVLDTTRDSTQVEITLNEFLAKGNEFDADGAVNSFIITSVTSGTLLIGPTAGTATPWAAGSNDVIDDVFNAYWTRTPGDVGVVNAFMVSARSNDGSVSTPPIAGQIHVQATPTLTTFATFLDQTTENTQVEVTFAELQAQGDEADADGTVAAFKLAAVSTGTLLLGASAETATPWAAGTNDTVNATTNAYWTPALAANGVLNAFTAVAVDNDGIESLSAIQAQIRVKAAPTLTSFTAPLDFTPKNVQAEITFAEIAAQGNETDVDGTVDAFVITGVTTGTLLIGASAGTATPWEAGVNDVVDATHNAYWTPDFNSSGTQNSFTVVARDNEGLLSITPIQAQVQVNSRPLLDASFSPSLTTAETVGLSLTAAAPTGAAGVLVSSLLAGASDPDPGSVLGMAITGFDGSASGQLWYSIDGGTTWTQITSASDTAAVLLDGASRVAFTPNALVAGSVDPSFTFRAWDLTAGTVGNVEDTTVETAYSLVSDTVSVSLTFAPSSGTLTTAGTIYYGGSDVDTVTITGPAGSYSVSAGLGDDVVIYNGSAAAYTGAVSLGGGSNNVVRVSVSGTNIAGTTIDTTGAWQLDIGGSGTGATVASAQLSGSSAATTITGGTGSNTITVDTTGGGLGALGTPYSLPTNIETWSIGSTADSNYVTLGAGSQSVTLGSGDDFIYSGATGFTSLVGGGGNDTLTLTGNTVNLNNVSGVEKLVAANGAANTFTNVGTGFNNFTLGDSGNTLTTAQGTLTIVGGAGADVITESAVSIGASSIDLDGGDDTLTLSGVVTAGTFTAAGSTTVAGGSGNDKLIVNQTNAVLDLTAIAFTGFESLEGGTNSQTIRIGSGTLSGVTSIDLLGGTDTLDARGGGTINISGITTLSGVENLIVGDTSATNFTMTQAQVGSFTSITGGTGNDTLTLTTAGTRSLANVSAIENLAASSIGANTFTNLTGFSNITLGSQGDTVTLTNPGAYTVTGGAGNDTLVFGGAGTYTGSVALAGGTNVVRLGVTGGINIAGATVSVTGGLWSLDIAATNGITGTVASSQLVSIASSVPATSITGAGGSNNALTVTTTAGGLGTSGAYYALPAAIESWTIGSTTASNYVTQAAGTQTLTFGAGDDFIKSAATSFAGSITGGAGNDTLTLLTPGANNLANVTGVEFLVAANGGANTLTNVGGFTNLTLGDSGNTVSGVQGPVTITGGAGVDALSSSDTTFGATTISLAGGDDTLTLSGVLTNSTFTAGTVTIDGGGGNDKLLITGTNASVDLSTFAFTGFESIEGGAGAQTVFVTTATLAGLTSIDLLGGTDTLGIGGGGTVDFSTVSNVAGVEAVAISGTGNTTLIMTATQANTSTGFTSITGGSGNDTLQLSSTGAVNLVNVTNFENLTAATGAANTFTNSSISHVTLGDSGDSLTITTPGAYTVTGGAGADTVVFGAAGTYTGSLALAGGTNVVRLGVTGGINIAGTTVGATGSWALDIAATNGITGTVASSQLVSIASSVPATSITGAGGSGNALTVTTTAGGLGTSGAYYSLAAAVESWTIGSTTASNYVTQAAGTQTLTFGAGDDFIKSAATSFAGSITGGAGNDTLTLLTPGANNLANVTGVEFLVAANGGANTLTNVGGFTNLTLGDSGNTVSGVQGPVTITGGAGVDAISSTDTTFGATTISLAGGDDTLTFSGVLTNSTFTAGTVTIDGGSGNDKLLITGTNASVDLSTFAFSNFESIEGAAGSQTVFVTTATLAGLTSIDLLGGTDTLGIGGGGTVDFSTVSNVAGVEAVAISGTGNTTLIMTATQANTSTGFTSITGGAGNDTLQLSSTGAVNLVNVTNFENLTAATGAANTFTNSSISHVTLGDSGDSLTITTPGAYTVTGGAGADTVVFGAAGTYTGSLALAGGTNVVRLGVTGGINIAGTTVGATGSWALDIAATNGITGTVASSQLVSIASSVPATSITGAGGSGNALTVTTTAGGLGTSGAYYSLAAAVESWTIGSTTASNYVTQAAGTQTLTFGAGDDFIKSAATSFAGSITGGAGNDTLTLLTPGANNLANVTGVEFLVAANGGANTLTNVGGFTNLTLGDSGNTVSGVQGPVTITGGAGVDAISSTDTTFGATTISLAGGDDTLTFSGVLTNSTFTAGTVTIDGGGGNDKLLITGTNASVDLSTFAFSNFESIEGAAGSQTVFVTTATLAGLTSIDLLGGTDTLGIGGGGTVDFSTVSNVAGVEAVAVSGSGNTTLIMSATQANTGTGFTSITGGGGNDTLQLSSSGAVNLVNVTNFEHLTASSTGANTFTNGGGIGDITLGSVGDSLTTNLGTLTVTGGAGIDQVTDSATSFGVSKISLGGSDDILTLSGVVTAMTAGSTIDGGSGNDKLIVSGSGSSVDLTGATFTGFESIEGAAGNTNQTVSLTAGQLSGITSINLGSATDSDTILFGGGGTINVAGVPITNVENVGLTGLTATTLQMTQAQVATTFTAITGGGGTQDTLQLTDSGTLSLTKVTNIENLLASSTGVNTFTNLTGFNNITLGSQGDSLTLTNAGAYTVTGGAGNDTVILGAGNTFTGQFALGAGTNVVRLGVTGANIAGVSVTATSGTWSLDIGGSGVSGTVSSAHLTGASAITGGTGTNTLTVDTTAGGLGSSGTPYTLSSLIENWSVGLTGTNSNYLTLGLAGQSVLGGAGDDVLSAGSFNGILSGGAGHDSITGGASNDTLIGGAGNDTMTGGTGVDQFDVSGGGTDTITDFGNGVDTLSTNQMTAGSQLNVTLSTSNNVTFSAATIAGTNGVVSVTGGAGNDTITGGAGNDTIAGGGGNDSMTGGSGVDTFNVSGGGTDTITDFGNGGAETLTGTLGVGSQLNVSLATGGVTFNAATIAATNGVVSVTGNSGADVITGGAGNDTLNGGTGTDTITGGAGNDTIDLGSGASNDVVILSSVGTNGLDTITSFGNNTEDKINVQAFSLTHAATGTSMLTAVTTSLDGGTNSVILFDDDTAGLRAADASALVTAINAITTRTNMANETLLFGYASAASGATRFAVVTFDGTSTATAATDVAIITGLQPDNNQWNGADFVF